MIVMGSDDLFRCGYGVMGYDRTNISVLPVSVDGILKPRWHDGHLKLYPTSIYHQNEG